MASQVTYPEIVYVTITDEELKIMRGAIVDLIGCLDNFTEVAMLNELSVRAREVRRELPGLLDVLGRTATGYGHRVVVLNLPESTVADIRPTPIRYITRYQPNLFPPDLYRGLLINAAGWHGYGFTTQQAGVIHNNVVPIRELTNTVGHSGNAVHDLGFHTEEAAFNIGPDLDISPDLLTLHCFRNPTSVPTVVAIPNWREFPPWVRETLECKEFFIGAAPAHDGQKNHVQVPASIIYGPADDPRIRVNFLTMELGKHSPAQQVALLELKRHLEARKVNLALRAGQIALIDNRRVAHGRSACKPGQAPRYDGTDRWCRRLVVSNNPDRLSSYEVTNRIVDPNSLIVEAARRASQRERT